MVLQFMRRAQIYLLPILLIAVIGFITLVDAVQAREVESMFLTGVIKLINHKSKQVVVDVKNKGCHGVMTFSIDDLSTLKAEEGDEIRFFIDSEYCPGTEVRKMSPQGAGRKQ